MTGDGERPSSAAPRAARVAANAWFFPAATAYAIVVVPASMLAMLGDIGAMPGLATPAGHAHEMLFGFALAVVAGNQLGPRTPRMLAILGVAWLLGRVAFVAAPGALLTSALNAAFPALLAFQVAPRLIGSAKKWRNQALPAALLAICAAAIASSIDVALRAGHGASRPLVDAAVALFALLLLFMGGRVIAPTVAGQLYRQGGNLDARVQPRLEGALIVAMAAAIAALAAEAIVPVHRALAGGALVAAGALASVRTLRWRLWQLRGRPDLLCLASGYAWLAVGLVLFGLAHAQGRVADETLAIHVITIGSLGTLTLNVMALTRLLALRHAPESSRLPIAGTLLLVAAMFLRLAGAHAHDAAPYWLAAAACWSIAFALLAVLLARLRGAGRKREARATASDADRSRA